MAKMTEQEKKDWRELCEWLEINIFNYDISKGQRLQKDACLILKGLSKGQYIINKSHESYGDYPYNVILMTFKANKNNIVNAANKKTFTDEKGKMSYICACVRGKLNDMYGRVLNAEKVQEKINKVNTSAMEYKGAEYQKTTKKINKRLEELW